MNDGETVERPTNLADLLAELVPPPEPEPISLMPETLGWPILVILIVAFGFFAARRVSKARRTEAYRKTALAALDAAGKAPDEVALVLRQTALAAFPRAKVAGLHGRAWLEFLVSTGGQSDFRGPHGDALITLPYSGEASLSEPTLALVRHWISHHDRALHP